MSTEELNATILRSIVDYAVVTLDANGNVTSWNEGAERILGWTEEEIVGRSADVFFTEADTAAGRPEKEMRIAMEEGRADDVRWHVRKGGQTFWGSGLMMPLLHPSEIDGEATGMPERVRGYVKIFRDRTSEREAEMNLVRARDLAALAMRRSGTIGIFDIDLQNDIVVADAASARLHSIDGNLAATGVSTAHFFDGVSEDDMDAAIAAVGASAAKGDDMDLVYRIIGDSVRPRWYHAQGRVQRDESDAPVRLTGSIVDVTEHRENFRMQEARLEFAEVVREMDSTVAIAELASRVIGETLSVSRVGHGNIAADGDTIEIEADWNEADGQSIVGNLKFSDFGDFVQLLHHGEDVVITDTQKDPRIADPAPLASIGIRSLVNLPLIVHGRLKSVMFINSDQPREWTEAELIFLRGMFDRTYAAIDLMHIQRERNVLAAEIAHRMKNVLTIAQIIVKQSLRNVTDIDEAGKTIEARLRALSSAQDVLTGADERAADIFSVIKGTLEPHIAEKTRLQLTGPFVSLNADQVLGLSLAFHELATNALKYGALSIPAGMVRINWSVDDEDIFRLSWIEESGPEVHPPSDSGFGTTILTRVVGSYFSGASEVHYNPEGVMFELKGFMT